GSAARWARSDSTITPRSRPSGSTSGDRRSWVSLRVGEERAPGVQAECGGRDGGIDGAVEEPAERRAFGAAADEHDDLARRQDRPDAERHRPVADRALEDLVREDVAHGPGRE